MITTIAITTVVLGYLAGRLHGHSAHKRFLARGFRLLSAAARRDGQKAASIHDLVVRPIDVSNAFGKQSDLGMQMIAVTHPISLKYGSLPKRSSLGGEGA